MNNNNQQGSAPLQPQQGQQPGQQTQTRAPFEISQQQAQQLLRQFNYEREAAGTAGFQTPEGREHIVKAERIKKILIEYNRRVQQNSPNNANNSASPNGPPNGGPNGMANAPAGQQNFINRTGSQSPQVPQQNIPGTRPGMGRVASSNNPSQISPVATTPVMNNNTPNQQQQLPQTQQSPQSSAGGVAAGPQGQQRAATPTDLQRQKYQQVFRLAEQTRNQLREIFAKKSNPQTPQAELQELITKEADLKSKYESYGKYLQQVAQVLNLNRNNAASNNGVNSPQSQQQTPQGGQQQRPNTAASSVVGGQMTPAQQAQHSQAEQAQIAQQQRILQQQRALAAQGQTAQAAGQVGGTPLSGAAKLTPQQQQAQLVAQQQRFQQQQQQQPQRQAASMNQSQPQIVPGATPAAAPISANASTPAEAAIPQTASQLQRPLNKSQGSQAASQPPQSRAAGSTGGANWTPAANANGAAAGPAATPAPAPTNVNSTANAITNTGPNPIDENVSRARFQNMAIPETLKINTPQPVSVKQNNRPSILGGNALNAPAIATPVYVKPPVFELEGERVLNKRKLKELIRTVSDEGDGEVNIDGDVEDLLLDIADEFVTSVTTFACKLAKHRKSDSVDVRDVQLNLERNWNIRLPGYANDEIRSVRKWVPSSSYNQKVNGVNISKSVNKNP